MRRCVPSQSRRKAINATDTTSAAAALYALELKRKSLRKRHQFLQESLNNVTNDLESTEQQIRELQARHAQLLNNTSLHPSNGASGSDDDMFTLSY